MGKKGKAAEPKEPPAPPPPPPARRTFEDTPPEARVAALINGALAGDLELLREYQQHNFDLDSGTPTGRTALMAAAWRGRQPMLSALLEGRCDLEQTDADGKTALMVAAESGQLLATKLLLEHNADPGRADLLEQTAIDKARGRGHRAVSQLLLNSALWRPHCERGAMVLPISQARSPTVSPSPDSPTRALGGVKLQLESPGPPVRVLLKAGNSSLPSEEYVCEDTSGNTPLSPVSNPGNLDGWLPEEIDSPSD